MDPATDWAYQADQPNIGLEFDSASNQHVSVGQQQTKLGFTAFGWFRTTGAQKTIISQWAASSGTEWYLGVWDVYSPNGPIIFARNQNGESTFYQAKDGSNDGQYHFVSVSVGLGFSSSVDEFYVDGNRPSSIRPGGFRTPFQSSWSTEAALDIGRRDDDGRKDFDGSLSEVGLFSRALSGSEHKLLYDQARRGFPDLLNRRDTVGLLGSPPPTISGAFTLTDSQEQFGATGQTEVSGILSVTDGSEALALSGAMIVSGYASITEAAEDVSATGEVKIAGTATLNDGTEGVIIVGQNDVTGSLSFADLATEIAAEGAVEVQGSLALTDLGESISVRERVPARLATVNVRLEDIIVVHATLEDALTVDAKLTD
jgi:hypothetical protein